MPTKKIGELPEGKSCTDPQHDPPKYMVYEEGVWEHTCPACGKVTIFTVRRPHLNNSRPYRQPRWPRSGRVEMRTRS